MSSKKKNTSDTLDLADDQIGSPVANIAAVPVYASSLAATNTYRSSQWYLDGYLTAGGNASGANVDLISTEYTGPASGRYYQIRALTPQHRPCWPLRCHSYDPTILWISPASCRIAPRAHGTWVAGVLVHPPPTEWAVGVASTRHWLVTTQGLASAIPMASSHLCASRSMLTSRTQLGFQPAFTDNFRKRRLGSGLRTV